MWELWVSACVSVYSNPEDRVCFPAVAVMVSFCSLRGLESKPSQRAVKTQSLTNTELNYKTDKAGIIKLGTKGETAEDTIGIHARTRDTLKINMPVN